MTVAPIRFNLGRRANLWRTRNGLSIDPAVVMTKLTEEIGEVARALMGELENRPGRGDMVQEAAQSILVLASLIETRHPGTDLFDEAVKEMDRLERIEDEEAQADTLEGPHG